MKSEVTGRDLSLLIVGECGLSTAKKITYY